MASRRNKRPPEPSPERSAFALVIYREPAERKRTRYEVMESVCLRIEAGELIDEAAVAEGIDRATVWRWARADKAFGNMYARAREASAESLEMLALRVCASSERHLPGARLLVDTLKWSAAKRRPKVYGDRVDLNGEIKHVHGVIILPAEIPDHDSNAPVAVDGAKNQGETL